MNNMKKVVFISILTVVSCLYLIVSANVFTDVDSNHWAKKEIEFFAKNGVVNGYSDGSFLPSNKVTREEFCKMLSVTLNISDEIENRINFTDVLSDRWSYSYIQQCHKFLGYYSDLDFFNPDEYATRGDVACALVSAIGYSTSEDDIYTAYGFSDAQDMPFEIMSGVGAAYNLGLISGYPDGCFRAQNGITRAEVLVVLKRSLDFIESQKLNKLRETDEFLNNKNMRDAYLKFLDENCVFNSTDMYSCDYYIYDIDKDGSEELIVKLGTNEAEMRLIICSYVNGSVVKIGEISGGHCGVHGNRNGKGLIVYYGHQGVEWIDSINIESGKLVTMQLMKMQEVTKYTKFDYTFPLDYYEKQNKKVFTEADQRQFSLKEKKVTFVQDTLYDMVSEEKYLPKITLYADGTFEFDCNYYSYMETLYGKFTSQETAEYITKYSFVVESQIPENRGSRPTFLIVHNELTNEVVFTTKYVESFGMTGHNINSTFSVE